MFREWIRNIVVFLIFITFIRQIIPEEKYQKYIRLVLGLIMILILLMPLTKFMGMDERIYQNFIRDQMEMSAVDAAISGKMFASEYTYNESYRKILVEEIKAYFEASSMIVRYCEIDMNEQMDSENYGEIYKINVGILPKDRQFESDENEHMIYVEQVTIGETSKNKEDYGTIPEEKINEWKQDLSLQFGIEQEQLKLEIVS